MDEASGKASAPSVALASISECHTGALLCLKAYAGGDGAVFSGGEDGAIRMWTTVGMQMFYGLEKDGFATEWRLGSPVTQLNVTGLKAATVGLNFEGAKIVCATGNEEVHEFPIDPERLRAMECEWSLGSPFSVVWAWRDPIKVPPPRSKYLSHD